MARNELERLADLARGKLVLEVGAHLGLSTIALASTAERVFSIDWHRGDQFTRGWGFTAGKYLQNLITHNVLQRVVPIIGSCYDVAEVLADETFDVVFIDADHSYDAVKRNIELYQPKMKPGGVICLHDYGVEGCFEKQAVDELFSVTELVGSLVVCSEP